MAWDGGMGWNCEAATRIESSGTRLLKVTHHRATVGFGRASTAVAPPICSVAAER